MTESLKQAVQQRYGAMARSGQGSDSPEVRQVATAFGYSDEQLASIPASANLGVSCGNPTALAQLKPGETVLDLGCGAGLDVLLAARQVGHTGRAIGIDMTADMLERARRGARQIGFDNVEFHQAEIEALPLDDASIDCAISNCVLNLVPDKARALSEIFRVLKPGGRLAVSDIALKRPLPDEVSSSLLAYLGCIGGAILIDEYRGALTRAGFRDVAITDTQADLTVYASLAPGQVGCCSPAGQADALPVVNGGGGCCDGNGAAPSLAAQLAELVTRHDVNEYAASVKIWAVKPPE